MSYISEVDPTIAEAIENERERQEYKLNLIASENYTSRAVMEAQGSIMTNKYAEGYPGKRYYGGCQIVDQTEQLAIDRACELFGAEYANVQPHSGAQANAAVFYACMQPGDTFLGLDLSHGGHLSHGSPVNLSGTLYNPVAYHVKEETGTVDYDELEQLALEHKPKMIVAGFSAYSRIMDWKRFRQIADSVGAYLFVDMAHVAGLVAAGLYPNPIDVADVVTSTTHKTLRGPRGGIILAGANSVMKNEDIAKKLNSAIFPGTQGGPLMHVIAAKAVAFKEALEPEFATYQKQVIVNAQAMADVVIKRGFNVVSGGTDNHLFLWDLVGQGLTGKEVEAALGLAHITVNKNAVPNDPQSPFVTSGIRVGTPAMTTRGFNEEDSKNLAGWMCDIIDSIDDGKADEKVIQDVVEKVSDICQRLPVYA
mgnify:CR=1 FL=1